MEGSRGPDTSVGAQIRECQKVAVPGGLPRGVGQDGVRESLGRLVASWAGGTIIVIPGLVGAEVALSRSHLVEPFHVELVETYKVVRVE